jgi:hypothetical protein
MLASLGSYDLAGVPWKCAEVTEQSNNLVSIQPIRVAATARAGTPPHLVEQSTAALPFQFALRAAACSAPFLPRSPTS